MNLLAETKKQSFVDLDAVFRAMTDEDYDVRLGGVSRTSFCNTYLEWIHHCNTQLKEVGIPSYLSLVLLLLNWLI